MSDDPKTIDACAKRLIEKCPDLVRDMASSAYIEFEVLKLRDGVAVEIKVKEKQYKVKKVNNDG